MHRNPLKKLLARYQTHFPEENVTSNFRRFVFENEDCFERSLEIGHVTASAWIVDPSIGQVLLVHHKKFGLWLQPGGHCDGDSDVPRVAKKEVQEETGLSKFHIFTHEIYDLDIHKILSWENVPEHLHYDVRFLIHADSTHPIQVSGESNDLSWYRLDEVKDVTPDTSVLRMVEKTAQMG